MSTRCTIWFHQRDDEEPRAIIYRHLDGYPDNDYGVLADLERFFGDVEAQTNDMRFYQPSYLAAKYVVWQAHRNAHRFNSDTDEWEPKEPLDFLSVGIVQRDPEMIEYRYHVWCGGSVFDQARPRVTWESVPPVRIPLTSRPAVPAGGG